MKLIIQIPCLNEEKTLPITLKYLPKKIESIDNIEILIINDGSTDRTLEVARECGVDHVVSYCQRRGLAEAFMAGLDACLKRGADIIVNTDADNQYYGPDIEKLIQPILKKEADIVVGNRETDKISHFSFTKKKFHKIGSWLVRRISHINIPDATSGFRAFSREAALRMDVITKFSYTVETLIQAGKKDLKVTSVPVRTNEKLRESRLFSGMFDFLKKSGATILRVYATHEPLKVFFRIGGTIFFIGIIFGIRYLYFFFLGQGAGHVQSVILSSTLMILGFILFFIGLVADLISTNRKLIEKMMYRIKKLEMDNKKTDDFLR